MARRALLINWRRFKDLLKQQLCCFSTILRMGIDCLKFSLLSDEGNICMYVVHSNLDAYGKTPLVSNSGRRRYMGRHESVNSSEYSEHPSNFSELGGDPRRTSSDDNPRDPSGGGSTTSNRSHAANSTRGSGGGSRNSRSNNRNVEDRLGGLSVNVEEGTEEKEGEVAEGGVVPPAIDVGDEEDDTSFLSYQSGEDTYHTSRTSRTSHSRLTTAGGQSRAGNGANTVGGRSRRNTSVVSDSQARPRRENTNYNRGRY